MGRFHINNNTENIVLAIGEAMAKMRDVPGSTLVIEPGEYHITTPRAREIQSAVMSGEYTGNPQTVMFSENFIYDRLFDFDGHKNTTVEAYGAKFIIDGFMENVSMRNSAGCTFVGGEFDHLRRPWSRGVITAQDDTSVTAEFPEEYRLTENAPHLRAFVVDMETGEYTVKGPAWRIPLECSGSSVRIPMSDEMEPSVGKYIYLWHTYHSRPCFLIYNSKNTTIKDAIVRTHPGMAVTAQVSENITVKRLKVIPPEGEFVSTNTDAVHVASCRGRLVIEDSMFVGMGDDGLNVHTYYMDILSADGTKAEVKIDPTDGTHAQLPCPPCAGDTIELTDATMAARDRFKLMSVTETGFNRYTLELDKPMGNAEGSFLSDIDSVPNTIVRNSVYKNHFARGVLIRSKKAWIENCHFENITNTAVKITPEICWREGIASDSVTVKGCKIVNCGWFERRGGGIFACNEGSDADAVVHGSITVEGCTLDDMPTENIIIRNTEHFEIK